VLADQFRADREIIDHLWDVLDDPSPEQSVGASTKLPDDVPQVSLLISGD
jgi:hypothetical protein